MTRQRIGVRRRVTKDELTENVIDELVQRIGMTDPNCELSMKTRKAKVDSSQIDDGDFERIMNGNIVNGQIILRFPNFCVTERWNLYLSDQLDCLLSFTMLLKFMYNLHKKNVCFRFKGGSLCNI